MTCVGTLAGKQLAGGPGHFEWTYSYGSVDQAFGGCVLTHGNGNWEANLPTADGSALALTGPWSWVGGTGGELRGQLGGIPVEMAWELFSEPDHSDEDCVSKPVSHSNVLGQGPMGL